MLWSKEQQKRIHTVLRVCAVLLAGGCAYAWICTRLGFGIPCPLYSLTGLQCPGCGVSRMAISLLKLDFQAAWDYNPAIMALLPWMAAVAADYIRGYIQTGTHRLRNWADVSLYIMIAILLLFGVARNLPFWNM